MKWYNKIIITLCLIIGATTARSATGDPIITFHSDAYKEVGASNQFSFLFGVMNPGYYTVKDAYGERQVWFDQALIEDGAWSGSWISLSADATGEIRIWGNAENINTIVADGAYLTSVDMEGCRYIDVLSLEHNNLKKLDLTPFENLMAIYLSDNPFTKETPCVIGSPKPYLQILEVDIIEHFDKSFNLSDYPALRTFDGYANYGLENLDPTGCPNLLVLSCEMSKVAKLDVTKNPNLLRLNISETRISEIDLSKNTKLEHFLGGHDSGSINTGYKLKEIDLSHNPELTIVDLNGNGLKSVDLSANHKLTNLSISHNNLKELDLSGNPDLYTVYCFYNDMDFATLPWPRFGQYFYRQNSMPVAKSIVEGGTLDMSARVLREGTITAARVWRKPYDSDPVLIDRNSYHYENGKITFPTAIPDSIYVEFINDVFDEYSLTTTAFKVKSASEFGTPNKTLTFIPGEGGEFRFHLGIDGASEATPKEFYVDFGDGKLETFQSISYVPGDAPNASGESRGAVTVYLPEGETATSLQISDIPLARIGLTDATELRWLTVKNAGLYDIDLRYNRCLQSLDVSGNNLYNLDLTGIYGDYEKNVLTSIDASDNELTGYTNLAPLALKSLNLSGNKLNNVILKDCDNLLHLDLSNNMLEETLDMTYLYNAEDVDVSGNQLTGITPCNENRPAHFDISGNRMTIATLPIPSEYGEGYIYAPQKEIEIPAKSASVNLRKEWINVEGYDTTFEWRYADGSPVMSGVKVSEGLSTFTDNNLGDIYCVVSNEAYPQLAGANELRTSVTHVSTTPGYEIASFTPTGLTSGYPSIIAAANTPVEIYIDFLGDQTYIPYTIHETATAIEEFEISANTPVRMYVNDETEANSISVFSISGMQLSHIDASKLTGLYCFGSSNSNLLPEDMEMPESPHLSELILTGNRLSDFPYAEKYPELTFLVLTDNNFQTFDASVMPQLMNLSLSGNQLTDVKFDNPNIWNLQLDNNRLEHIDLSGLKGIDQLFLNNNYLSEIDLSPVKGRLRALSLVNNRFTFATLPLQSEWGLDVYYYGIQEPVEAECVKNVVDLSSQAWVGGVATQFDWYEGIPEYNEETGEIEGDLLEENVDYTIENGVTTFLTTPSERVICVMTNEELPNLTLITWMIRVSSVDSIHSEDPEREVTVYSAYGTIVKRCKAKDVAEGLAHGIYIVDGKKIIK